MIGCSTCKHSNEQNRTFWYFLHFLIAITSITQSFRNLSYFMFQCRKGKRERLVLVVKLLVVSWGRGSRTSNYNWLEQNKSRGREGKGGGAIVGFALFGAQPLSVQSTFVFCNGLLVMLCNGLLLMQSVYLSFNLMYLWEDYIAEENKGTLIQILF